MSFKAYRPFKKKNLFPKYLIVFIFGISFALFFSSAFTIVTGINNAVQYIKQIVLTSDGTSSGTTGIVLDGATQRFGVGVSNPNNSIQVKDLINFDNLTASTFLGYMAGGSNNGSENIGIGRSALYNSNIGSYNVAIGNNALYNNVNGANDIAIGLNTLQFNTNGSHNVAIGNNALGNNTTSSNNTAIGDNAIYLHQYGNSNTAIGWSALSNNIIGNNNIAIGRSSIYNNTGNNNIAIGNLAGENSIGDSNIFLGQNAGYNKIGSNKLYIANTGTKTLIYGEFNNNRVGINTTNPQATLDIAGDLEVSGTGHISDLIVGKGVFNGIIRVPGISSAPGSSNACTSAGAGAIKYEGGLMELCVCDGTNRKKIYSGTVLCIPGVGGGAGIEGLPGEG